MTTAIAHNQRHSPSAHSHQYRHHPYAPSSSTASGSGSGSRSKWQTPNNDNHAHIQRDLPPSPPRSRRDTSETPSTLGLGIAFGGNTGGKWWDEELPSPPASLSSILDSFRRSGEGDRELLLAILGAKKAEEERLTSLIQTRLTVLQARLSLHSAAAAVAQSQVTSSPYSPQAPHLEVTNSSTSLSARNAPHAHHRASTSSSPNSPPLMTPVEEVPSHSFDAAPSLPNEAVSGTSKKLSGSYWQLSSSTPSSSHRDRSRSPRHDAQTRLPPIRLERPSQSLSIPQHPPARTARPVVNVPTSSRKEERGSVSPKTSDERGRAANGLDMLLDAGMGRGAA